MVVKHPGMEGQTSHDIAVAIAERVEIRDSPDALKVNYGYRVNPLLYILPDILYSDQRFWRLGNR